MPVPYRVQVYEKLRQLYKRQLLHIPTSRMVDAMGQGYYRTYRALRALEKQGVISRKSSHSGWRPALMASAAYGVLLSSYRRAHDFIPTNTIAIQLNTNPRIIRGELAMLETAGIVLRSGDRGGWKPVRQQPTTALEKIMDTLHTLAQQQHEHIPTKTIAQELDVHPSYVRRQLSLWEADGIVSRTSPRSGWQPVVS